MVLSLALAAAVSPAAAQATLTGTVTNSATGAVLEGARVQLKGSTLETTTDNLGAYRLEGLPAGEAVLLVTYTACPPPKPPPPSARRARSGATSGSPRRSTG